MPKKIMFNSSASASKWKRFEQKMIPRATNADDRIAIQRAIKAKRQSIRNEKQKRREYESAQHREQLLASAENANDSSTDE